MIRRLLEDRQRTILAEYGIGKNIEGVEYFTFEPGETVLQEGMPMEYLFIVTSGTAKVCCSAGNGRDVILSYYISDGLIGDVELMTEEHTATTMITAVSPVECIALPYRTYAVPLKSNVTFLNKAGRALALKLRRSTRDHTAAALNSGGERLCSYILQTAINGIFSETLTDTARRLGISYRHLFRLLGRLCSTGVLRKQENGYMILNRNALEKHSADSTSL